VPTTKAAANRIKFTQAAVDRLQPPTDRVNITYWDNLLPGFGLRISARGRRTWIAMYRVNGRAVMETLPTMAVTPDVGAARALARASMTKARSGVNPVEEAAKEKAAKEAAAQAEKKTFSWLIEHTEQGKHGEVTKGYLAEYAQRNQRPSTQYETRRILKRAMPYLGHKLISEIKRADITELLDDVVAKRQTRKDLTGGPSAEAQVIQTVLTTVFRWAVEGEHIAVSPMASIPKNRHGKSQPRERFLSAEEIKAFWSACDQIGWPWGSIGKLLLLTGQRCREVSGMRWDELQDTGRWTLPGHRTKNGKSHVVYLSPQANKIINGLPRLVGDEFVFSATGKAPVTDFSSAKEKVDAMMRATLAQQDRTLPPWVWHDLRRTVVTGMSENGVAPHIVEAVVNHISGSKGGVAGVYNRAVYATERQAAMETWGKYIDEVIGLKSSSN